MNFKMFLEKVGQGLLGFSSRQVERAVHALYSSVLFSDVRSWRQRSFRVSEADWSSSSGVNRAEYDRYFVDPEWGCFRQYLSSSGVEVTETFGYGEGETGAACYIFGGFAVKLTPHREEAETAALTLGKNLPVAVLDVVRVGGIYAILQKKVIALNPQKIMKNSNARKLFSDFNKMCNFFRQELEFGTPPRSEAEWSALVRKFISENPGNATLFSMFKSALEVIYLVFKETGRVFSDTNYTNWGKPMGRNDNDFDLMDGEWLLFDMGLFAVVVEKQIPDIKAVC